MRRIIHNACVGGSVILIGVLVVIAMTPVVVDTVTLLTLS